ncbi:MAG: hypothetical protein EXQ58_03840 [Acidobacteria bacterium]|nr:hypothetical protein [Acidobacteriota bacterium]
MRRREFLQAASYGMLSAGLVTTLSAETKEAKSIGEKGAARKKRRLVSNDDGAIMALEPPLTVEHLRQMVRTYKGTPVDALFWCVGDREVYTYDTKVAEVFGQRRESFDNAWDWRVYQNTQSFIRSGKCPLATLVDVCHASGMEIFPSVRMNSHYQVDPKSPASSKLRLDHPELLIGVPTGYSEGSKEYAVRMGLNYARYEVQQHMAAIIIELFERFAVDGVELDFMRHPVFFKLHEATENHHHMTNMLRHIKRKRDEVSQATGRSIDLALRVPPSIADAWRMGLDVRTWIKEGLADILIAGGGFIPFDMPFEEFVEAARGSDCQVFGCLELLRFMQGRTLDEEVNRAIAMRYWKAGADGLHLFNFFAQSTEWKQKLFREIGNPATLANLNKRYQMDRRRWAPGNWGAHGGAFASAVPAVQLPVTLTESPAGMATVLNFSIADDLKAAKASGTLAKTQLRLQFENYTSQDKLEVRLNGQLLPEVQQNQFDLVAYWNKGSLPGGGQFLDGTIDYGVQCPPLQSGKNTLEVRLVKRCPKLVAPVTLGGVEIAIQYQA